MSQDSAFEIDEEMDFESMWNSSIAAAENQEKDVQYPNFQNQEQPAAVEEPNVPEVKEVSASEVPSAIVEEEESGFDYESLLEEVDSDSDYEQTNTVEEDSSPSFYNDDTVADEAATEYVQETYEAPAPIPAPAPVPEKVQAPAPEPEPELEEALEHEEAEFSSDDSGARNIKTGVDKNVSLETLLESFEILDAYRSLESDEREFAAIFMGLEEGATEPEVVSTVMNANPLLFDVFEALEYGYSLDDTNIAFYIVGLPTAVIEGISFVASEYLNTDMADSGQKKIPYAREVVSQMKQLDDKAMRLIKASHSLIKGEKRSEDDILSN